MKTSKELYGIDLIEYKDKPYEEVLLLKIKASKKLLDIAVRKDNMQYPERIRELNGAIDFNKNLLRELGYNDKDISNRLKD